VRGDAPPEDRVAVEKGPKYVLAVAVAAFLALKRSAKGPAEETSEHDRKGVVEPHHRVGAGSDELACLAVIARDNPLGLFGSFGDEGAELLNGTLDPVGQPIEVVEIGGGDTEASFEVSPESRFTGTARSADPDTLHAQILR
jgi:hypothetical protein